MLSFWRNDEHLDLMRRADHLLSKKGSIKWLWVVGDSDDKTFELLRKYYGRYADVLQRDTHVIGETTEVRRIRGSRSATMAFAELHRYTEQQVLLHESDLQTPENVLELLEQHADNNTVVAGWPVLNLNGEEVFYDIWAYRGKDGHCFGQRYPYHPDYRKTQPFEVQSLGSVWLAPRVKLAGRQIEKECVVELCKQWFYEGVRMLVDPTIRVEQPQELWVCS